MQPFPKPLRLASRFLWLAACSLALPSSLLAQNAITPTAVNTSSMWDNPGLGGNKEKMRDGSGLSGPGSVLTQGHDNNSNVNSWHVGNLPGGISGGTTGNPPPVLGQVVEFDLGANYNLSAAHIWNFNAAGFTGRGIKDVTILVSSSASGPFNTLFSTQFAQASGLSNQLAQVVPISVNNVRRVRFAIQSAWSGVANEYVGLSEVRFSGAIRSVLLDDFSAAFNTVTGGTAPALLSTIASGTHGTTQFGETVSASIMGNNRQAGVRDGHSANPAAMTIQDGKVQFHGTASAPNRFLRYGSSVGTANPFGNPSAAPFSSGTVTPLNLSLLPEHQLLIDVSQMPNPTTAVGFVITLVNGSGASAIASVPASSTGVARVLLSNFSGMTAQFAADIDGISILVNGQGSTAATGLHVDSIRFALEDLVIDDFSAGFQVVDGGTAPSLLSSTGGTTRFGETVSGSIIGNNRHAGLRDGQSNQASMTIQDGKVQFHGNGVAQSRFLRYGNTVGTTNPLAFPTEKAFGSGTVTPLNLPLRLEHQIIIDITQKPDQTSVASFDVTLASGTGGSLTVNAQTTTLGRLRIPLSTFAGITPQFAADIDGITIRTDSQSVQGTTAANGMHIDSIIIATESLVIDDFSAGFNTVTGGTAPALLSTITGSHGTSRFGETVSTSIIGNNRQAGVRDGHSANPTAMTIQDGKVQIHGTASAPNRFLRYGSSVGTANPLGNPSTAPFSSGTVTPLNLSLKPEDLLLIDIVQKPDQVTATGFTVTLTSGAGGPVSSAVSTTTTGILSIPLSGFAGMTPQIAADIDGITVLLGDQASQGSTAATGMHIDSIAVAFAKSNNADLSALATTAGVLTPTFAAATTSYNATVPNGTATITVTPTVAQADATVMVNGVTVTSGSASSAIALTVGTNTITTAVTAQSGFVKTYTLTVTRSAPLSNNADLSALATTAGTLTPSFAAATTSYTASVPNGTTGITVTPTIAQANATVRVNTVVVASGTASGNIALNVGSNTITTVVTAQDGTTTKTYTLTVTRAASNNADLSALATTAGTLTPSFAAATTSYTATVPNATTGITVTPTIAQANATVRVNSVVVASGTASGNIALNVGTNTITTVVTAQDGTTTKTYTLTVTRAVALTGVAIQPTAVNTTSMWDNSGIGGHKSKMIDSSGLSGGGSVLTQTHDNNSNVNSWHAGTFAGGISGGTTGNPPAVSGQAVEFDLGANYDLTGAHIWNFNGAGFTGRGIKDVQILISSSTSGAFTALTTTQFTQATGGASLVAQVLPFTGATNVRRVRFAIQSAWSGAANEYVGLSEVRFQGTAVPLSNNADLAALTTTAGALTPAFAAATISYNANVPNATTGITVTPTVAQANATVKVNTVTVASGAVSGNIALNVGTNTITTVVTAQDGTTTKTYTLTVTRAAAAIPPSGNVLTPSVITTSQWTVGSDGSKDQMVNSFGLSGSGSDETKLHDAQANAGSMWHAGPFAGGIVGGTTGTPPSVASQAIEFDLGANYNLTGAHVWNLNQPGALGRGVRGVEIFISPDATGTATWTSVGTQEFTQGTGLPLAAQAVSFTGSNARRVRFAIQSAWSGAANDYVGLSEVRFRGVFAPVSAVGTNLGAIPDNNPTGREILFNVTGAAGVVKTVSTQFTFNPAHAYMSDLRVQLIAPNGTSAWIYQPSEVRANDLLGPYTIADSGTASLQTAATGVTGNATLASGTYRAANGATLVSLNLSFGGTSPNGTWKLRFVDSAVDDAGTVSQASLTLTTAGPGKTTILRETNGHMTLSLTAADSNANYDLMRSTDLLNWTLLQSKTTNASGVTTHTDTAPPSPRGFYLFIPRP